MVTTKAVQWRKEVKGSGTTACLSGGKVNFLPHLTPHSTEFEVDHVTERKSEKSKGLQGNTGQYLCEFGADRFRKTLKAFITSVCQSYLI